MKKIFILFLLGILVSCSKNENNSTDHDASIAIKEINFAANDNYSLSEDINLNYDGESTFSGTAPYGSDIHNLVARIILNQEDGHIIIDGDTYLSGVSEMDFSKETIIKVYNSDQTSSREYILRLSYYTGIPVLNIDTDGQPIDSKEEYIEATISLFGGLNFEDIDLTELKIKGRGNSTWWQGVTYGKKPYQMKFGTETEILGMPPDRKWVLLAEWSDKTLLRNKITFQLGHLSQLDYTPHGELIEVFINGSPQGTYLLAQKVEVSENRVNIGDTGYLIEIDQIGRMEPDDVFFTPDIFTGNYPDNVFNIKEPELDIGNDQYNLIVDHINNFETALFGENFKDPDTGYRAYIDVPSFVDWYLINEISKTVDAKWYSSIYFTYIPGPGNKIKMGPLWDFDLSYGNVDYCDAEFSNGFWVKYNPWISRLFEDPYFADQVNSQFAYYDSNLNFLLSKIDELSEYIDASQSKNYEIWQTLGQYVWPNPVYFDTHEEEVEHLKQWITSRMYWLRNEFN